MTYIQNIKSRLLSIRRKFPLVDSGLNQIQGVHLKFIEIIANDKNEFF